MVRLIILITILFSLSGCTSDCEKFADLMKNDSANGIERWVKDNVLNVAWEKENLYNGPIVSMGNATVKRKSLIGSGIVPEKFRQLDLIGNFRKPDGVFLSVQSFNGVLISRGSVREILELNKISSDQFIIVNNNVAAVCVPMH
jgi:hypothetical protein